MATRTFRLWRGQTRPGRLPGLPRPRSARAWSCSTPSTRSRRSRRTISRAAGTARPASAARARPRSTDTPKLMCMTRLDELPADQPITVEPMRAFPHVKDLVTDVSWNFEVKKKIKAFTPRKPDAPDGTWRMQQEDIDRVQEFRKCIECFLCQDVCHVLRDHHKHERVHRPAVPRPRRRARDAPARHRRSRRRAQGRSSASATATSPSAARRCAPSTSRSPTTRSSRSRSASSIGSTIRSRSC